uniref:NADH-ubiquinone oxidoreductase chain 2 n=1 Tax=Trocnadella arisana TaxID=1437250 RepID=A0A342KAF9_9HEMI|nr:NADH dehydrogenase subunit 2 [Trocnadella arisana]AMY96193.1 NADH dehydrogenase subunit 2 [Trocnadella arisana]
MNKNSSNMMFFSSLMFSFTLSLTTNSMIIMWMMIEMSTLSFIPLMMNKKMLNSESIMKFFIMQSLSSSMLIFSMILMFMKMKFNNLLIMSLIMKMGGVPFQNWLLSMIEGMSYYSMVIMFTFMKIPPFIIINEMNEKLTFIIILSVMFAPVLMINQIQIKKILAYSSIFNMSNMLMLASNNKLWITFLSLYTLLLMMNVNEMKKNKIFHINQMLINNKSKVKNSIIWLSMLSMGGMPPLMGFLNKLMVIKTLIEKKELILLMMMIFSSSMIMFMYMKLCVSSILMSMSMSKYKILILSFNQSTLIIMNLLTLPISIMIKVFN